MLRQSGGRGQYGHCCDWNGTNMKDEYEFENAIVGGAIPKEYIPAIDAWYPRSMLKWYICWISSY